MRGQEPLAALFAAPSNKKVFASVCPVLKLGPSTTVWNKIYRKRHVGVAAARIQNVLSKKIKIETKIGRARQKLRGAENEVSVPDGVVVLPLARLRLYRVRSQH